MKIIMFSTGFWKFKESFSMKKRLLGIAILCLLCLIPISVSAINGEVLNMHFDEGSGTSVSDTSGYNNHGTNIGSTWEPGVCGSAIAMDGTQGYVDIPDSPSLKPQSLTISLWVKPNIARSSIDYVLPIVDKTNGDAYLSADGYDLRYNNFVPLGYDLAGISLGLAEQSNVRQATLADITLPINQWSHIVVTYDEQSIKYYNNGQLVNSLPYSSPIYYGTGNLWIGRWYQVGENNPAGYVPKGNYFFNGAIDELSIYSRALSASEIQDIFAAGSEGVCQNQPPVAYAGPDQSASVGTLVTLDGSGSSDPDNNLPLTYAWIMSAPSGSTATLSSTTAAKPTFTPDKNGDYIITLTVKDSLGLQSTVADRVTITVTNQPLVADFEIYPKDDPTTTNYKPAGNTIPMVGGVIRFDARKSTGDIVKYRWDLDDNKGILETYEPIVEHIYREEKTYKVKLEIIDKNGKSAKKKIDFTIPKLQKGDIIFCNTKGYGGMIPGFYTHTGIYIGNGKIVETVASAGHGLPANGVGISDIKAWSYPKETAVAVYRPMISDKYIKNSVKEAKDFATQKRHITYDFDFRTKSQAPDRMYCSELVWAAYSLGSGGEGYWITPLTWINKNYGTINLGNIGGEGGITPSDIAKDSRLLYVAGHWEDEPGSPS